MYTPHMYLSPWRRNVEAVDDGMALVAAAAILPKGVDSVVVVLLSVSLPESCKGWSEARVDVCVMYMKCAGLFLQSFTAFFEPTSAVLVALEQVEAGATWRKEHGVCRRLPARRMRRWHPVGVCVADYRHFASEEFHDFLVVETHCHDCP